MFVDAVIAIALAPDLPVPVGDTTDAMRQDDDGESPRRQRLTLRADDDPASGRSEAR